MRRIMRFFTVYILSTLILFLCLPGESFCITGREIMERSKKANQSETQVTDIHMLLIDKKGKEQERAVKIWAIQGDVDRSLTRFTKPKSVAGVGFLVLSEGGKAKRWLYMPKSKKTRMIAEGDKNKTFMGTDFTYYDLSPHDLDNETFDRVKEAKVDGHACYEVRGRSKTPETSLYGDVVKFIRKDNYVPIRVDFYDKSGKLLKRSKVLDLKKIDGNWTPMKMEMHNVQIDHKTIMTVKEVEYDMKIPSKTFTKTNLEKGR
ncbi:MAG: outer membrane lipoprotein-sorting protein [Candidatus Glassbacteria bacterium]